jgi:hypothetical protein
VYDHITVPRIHVLSKIIKSLKREKQHGYVRQIDKKLVLNLGV